MPRNFTLLFAKAALVAKSWDLLSPSIFEELERRRYVYALSAPCRAASQGMPAEERRYCPPNLGRKQAFWVMHSAYLFLDARLHRSMTVISPKDMSIEDALPITMQMDTQLRSQCVSRTGAKY